MYTILVNWIAASIHKELMRQYERLCFTMHSTWKCHLSWQSKVLDEAAAALALHLIYKEQTPLLDRVYALETALVFYFSHATASSW